MLFTHLLSYDRKKERGQALIIIVLVMVVVLTVSFALATRSITNLRLSTEETESQRALSAAEAGIEQSLQSDSGSTQALPNNASFRTTVSEVRGSQFLANNGSNVQKNDGVDIWLSTYSATRSQRFQNPWTGTLVVYWGTPGNQCLNSPTNTMAALEIITVTGTAANPTTTYYPLDPCATRRSVNRFCPRSGVPNCVAITTQNTTISNKTFAYSARIPVNTGLLARITPIYAATPIAVAGQNGSGSPLALPAQGSVVESVGSSGTTQRKISVFKGNPKLPSEFFSFTLFSP